MTVLYRLYQLYGLAFALRRYGALRALGDVPYVPPMLIWAMRIFTFFVPHKSGLPPANGERLALALAKMGPAYIKLGQTLATRPDVVGRGLADGLATLQDRLPPFSIKAARAAIESELGGTLEDHFTSFEETAIAAASIAQVHKAVTTDGETVAVKILRPNIDRKFMSDIALFGWIARLAEKASAEARRLQLTEVIAKVWSTSQKEMDLRLEASAAAELSDLMAGEAGYRIPRIDWNRSGRSVMTLEWVSGIRLGDRAALEAAGHDLSGLGARIVRVFLKQAMRDGYFHADLHQGNLIVEENGTIVAIDFGIMGRLSLKERQFFAEILFGFISRNYRRVAEVHFEAGYVPPTEDVEEFAQALRAIADPIMDLPVEQISAGKLLAQLFATTERFKMETQPQLILLQRSMVMVEGLALHLDETANMWTISRPTIEDWMQDHLSLESRLADLVNRLPSLIARLPVLLDRLTAPELMQESPPQAPAPTVIKSGGHWVWPLLSGFLLGAIAVGLMIAH